MTAASEHGDRALLDLLRKSQGATIAELCQALSVTATAVRQRLTRLTEQGLVARTTDKTGANSGRGRPTHRYTLTEKARRQTGSNFADLATVLWRELRNIPNLEVRRGLLQRLATHMAGLYADQIQGETLEQRMASLVTLFAERSVPFRVERPSARGARLENLAVEDLADDEIAAEADAAAEARASEASVAEDCSEKVAAAAVSRLSAMSQNSLPVLVVEDCPYPQLAEEDRGICSLEKLLFSQLLDEDLRLAQCRLDGHACCQFQTSS